MHFAEENLPYSPILQPSASAPKPQWGRSQRTRRASNFNQNWVPEIDNNRDTFGTIHQVWKAEVNDALAAETKKREDKRHKRATKHVPGASMNCHGVTSVARGLGEILLSKVNRPDQNNHIKVGEELLKDLKIRNVAERRQGRHHMYHRKAWEDKRTSLNETPIKRLIAMKLEYEERRKWLRESTLSQEWKKRHKKRVYNPVNVASQHSIEWGTPEIKRKEYDERRAFLKSNLSSKERAAIARHLNLSPQKYY